MRIGIAFQTDKQPNEYAALARLVESFDADGAGFDVVSVYNDLLYQPALGPLLLMAPHLRRAQLGPAALNPSTIHPLEIAGQVALLDLATGGRAYLGLARGAWLDALGIKDARPLARLREAILLIRHLLARRPEAFAGTVFSLVAGATLRYRPLRADVPVIVGTWGQRAARVAGALADEVKVGGSANPSLIEHLVPALRAGEADAGRPPGRVGICLGAVTVVDRDREAARALARREVALYLPVVAALDPSTADSDWLARLRAFAARGDLDAVAADISDDVLERFAFAGTPADVVKQVARCAEAGAARVEFGTPHGLTPETGIRLLGEEVLPALRGLRG